MYEERLGQRENWRKSSLVIGLKPLIIRVHEKRMTMINTYVGT